MLILYACITFMIYHYTKGFNDFTKIFMLNFHQGMQMVIYNSNKEKNERKKR